MKRDHAAELAELERLFRGGRRRAALDAIYICICSRPQKPVPQWASQALAMGLHEIAMAKAGSWDDVFGKPHHGRKLSLIRKSRPLHWPVFARVEQLKRQKPKPRHIYSVVAGEFKIEVSSVKTYHRHVLKNWFGK